MLLIGFGVFASVLGLGSVILGFFGVHRRTGPSSVRPGSGRVGHQIIHSSQGVLVGAAVVLGLAAVGLFVR